MKRRLSRLLVVVGAFALVSLAAIPIGHANSGACSVPSSPNPQHLQDNNEGSKRIYWDLWESFFGYGIVDITSVSGGFGNWSFKTTLFVQSTQGIVDSKQGTGTVLNPNGGDLVSAPPPPFPDYWYFSCGTTDPI